MMRWMMRTTSRAGVPGICSMWQQGAERKITATVCVLQCPGPHDQPACCCRSCRRLLVTLCYET